MVANIIVEVASFTVRLHAKQTCLEPECVHRKNPHQCRNNQPVRLWLRGIHLGLNTRLGLVDYTECSFYPDDNHIVVI
jgi:hypothetical protein